MRPAKDPLRKEPPGVGGAPAKGTLLTGAEPAATTGARLDKIFPVLHICALPLSNTYETGLQSEEGNKMVNL